MVKSNQIEEFINYNFIPFSKRQCIKRIFFIGIASYTLCILGLLSVPWVVVTSLLFCIPALFLLLLTKSNDLKLNRFLCDGIYHMTMSIIFNLAAYRVVAWKNGTMPALLMVFMSLLILSYVVCTLVVHLSIKHQYYRANATSRKVSLLAFGGCLLGSMVARLSLNNADQQLAVTLLSTILLLLSFVIGIGGLNLLKAWLYLRGTD
jgi:hypothetical protein